MDLNGWYVGFVVASVVIVIVVALVGWILSLANRISGQVNDIVVAIAEIKETTAPLPAVGKLNETLGAVAGHAVAARIALVGEG